MQSRRRDSAHRASTERGREQPYQPAFAYRPDRNPINHLDTLIEAVAECDWRWDSATSLAVDAFQLKFDVLLDATSGLSQ